MAKKIKLEMTEAQMMALVDLIDESSSMIGVGEDEDIYRVKRLRLLDRMLKNNGYKREFS